MRPTKRTKKELRAIQLISLMPTKQISKITGIPVKRMRSLETMQRTPKGYYYWSQWQLDKVKELYGVIEVDKLAEIVGKSKWQVYRMGAKFKKNL